MAAWNNGLKWIACGLCLCLFAGCAEQERKLQTAKAEQEELKAALTKAEAQQEELLLRIDDATKTRDECKKQLEKAKGEAEVSAKRAAFNETQLAEMKSA